MIGREGQNPAEARFVPPPPPEMQASLNDLEKYIGNQSVAELEARGHVATLNGLEKSIGNQSGLPTLVDLALIHYQFETIHPFEDGNGRLGRLLISLLLCERKCLTQPLLYLSAYLERHRERYMDHLLAVSQKGDWMGWIDFFLRAVAVQSRAAVARGDELLGLQTTLRERVQKISNSATMLKLIDLLFEHPAVTNRGVSKALGVSFPAIQNNLDKLVRNGILSEATGKSRNRIYIAQEIIDVIEKDEAAEED